MTDEGGAGLNQPREFSQWEALGDFGASDGQGGGKTLQAFAFGFSADQEEIQIRGMDELLQQFGPLGFRPIFLFTAAARVERDLVEGGWLRVKRQARKVVRVENGEAFQRAEIDFCGVDFFTFVGAIGSDDELGLGATADVGFENVVGVVKVGDDDVEFGEIVRQIFGEDAAAGEEAGEGAGFDGLDAVDEAAGLGELDNMGIAQDFEVGLGKLLPQGGDGGQREDEISNGAAANDQDFSASRLHEENWPLMEFRQAEDGD